MGGLGDIMVLIDLCSYDATIQAPRPVEFEGGRNRNGINELEEEDNR
jgi:hypothetical protein